MPKTLKDVMIETSYLHNGHMKTADYMASINQRKLEKNGYSSIQFSNYCVEKYEIKK